MYIIYVGRSENSRLSPLPSGGSWQRLTVGLDSDLANFSHRLSVANYTVQLLLTLS